MQVSKAMMLTVLFAVLSVIATVLCLVPAAAIPVVLFDRGVLTSIPSFITTTLYALSAAFLLTAAVLSRFRATRFQWWRHPTTPPNIHTAAAVAMGAIVGVFPAWALATLTDWQSPSEFLPELSWSNPNWGFIVVAVILSPLGEEVFFRGLLWDVWEKALPQWAVILATTLLFSAAHMPSAVQVTGLLWTGAALGVLRYVSGSFWLPFLAHAANNGMAVMVSMGDTSEPTSMTTALLCAVVVLSMLYMVQRGPKAEHPG